MFVGKKTEDQKAVKAKQYPIDEITHDIRDYLPLLHKERKSEHPEAVRTDNLNMMNIYEESTLNFWICELYSIQHYVIKFISDLRQVVGFLRVLRFPPPIKLDATEILLKVALTTLTLTPVCMSYFPLKNIIFDCQRRANGKTPFFNMYMCNL